MIQGMATISSDTIVCEFDDLNCCWFAHFESFPAVRFNGTVPMNAVEQLLQETGAEPALYPFQCDPIEGMPEVAYRMIGWHMPEKPDGIYLSVWPKIGPHCRWPREVNPSGPPEDPPTDSD
jgi:hypothetical protein